MPAGHTSEIDTTPVAQLADEVAQLRDLFQRRLLEDKAKNRLIDDLHEQLQLVRGALAEQMLAPLLRELLLITDRVRALVSDGDEALECVLDELHELLARRDVRRVPRLETFDPTYHEAVRAQFAHDRPPGTILAVVRPGYVLGQQLLRAEQVTVAAEPESSEQELDSN